MKLQSLAVLFIIIILPISIVLEEYTRNQAYTVKLQAEYDSRLRSATYDAVKVFQMNTVNSDTSDLSNSKMRDISASANSFFNSLSSNFNMEGYKKDVLQDYVPALVYTMYDGYYIYGPYTNEFSSMYDVYVDETDPDRDDFEDLMDDKTYYDGQTLDGLQPYIYYSGRFTNGYFDVVITFSLDNYVTIDGYNSSGNPIYLEGYVVDGISGSGSSYNYKITSNDGLNYESVTIELEKLMEEQIPVDYTNLPEGNKEQDPQTKSYNCIKQNGVTYYQDGDGTWFSILNGEKYPIDAATILRGMMIDGIVYQDSGEYTEDDNGWYKDENKINDESALNTIIEQDTSAIQFYAEAAKFKELLIKAGLINSSGQSILTTAHYKGIDDEDTKAFKTLVGEELGVFDYYSTGNIENWGSDFNMVREAVIRRAIEKNLSIVIANYNKNLNSGSYFQMPTLTEEEWSVLTKDVTVISFLQGITIGSKTYNGHSIVPNTKTKEVVTEESIYIDVDNVYYKATDTKLTGTGTVLNNAVYSQGISNLSVERRLVYNSNKELMYYYPIESVGSYSSIVSSTGMATLSATDTIHDYFTTGGGNSTLAKIYYTALARERQSSYKNRN